MTLRSLFLLCLGAVAACTGTDVGNPPRGGLADFETPGCKHGDEAKALPPSVRGLALNDSAYAGLTCFVWQRSGEDLRIEVTNYAAGCGSDAGWKPSSRLRADGALELVLDNPTCLSAKCGWCLYDLGFEVRDVGVMSQALEVHVLGDTCSDERSDLAATLAIDDAASGVVCSYANKWALDWHACELESTGQERMPCGVCREPGSTTCAAGLTCTEVEPEHSLCLASCSSDADCAPRDVLRCEDGVCRLPAAAP